MPFHRLRPQRSSSKAPVCQPTAQHRSCDAISTGYYSPPSCKCPGAAKAVSWFLASPFTLNAHTKTGNIPPRPLPRPRQSGCSRLLIDATTEAAIYSEIYAATVTLPVPKTGWLRPRRTIGFRLQVGLNHLRIRLMSGLICCRYWFCLGFFFGGVLRHGAKCARMRLILHHRPAPKGFQIIS